MRPVLAIAIFEVDSTALEYQDRNRTVWYAISNYKATISDQIISFNQLTHLFVGLANEHSGPLAGDTLGDILHSLIIVWPLVVGLMVNCYAETFAFLS